MKKVLLVLSLLLATALLLWAVPSKSCPLCGSRMMWTGQTRTEWGKLVYEMRCPAGHISWEVDSSYSPPATTGPRYRGSGPSCQYDGSSMYFTGQTRTEWGKLLYQYKCPAGHTSWVTQ